MHKVLLLLYFFHRLNRIVFTSNFLFDSVEKKLTLKWLVFFKGVSPAATHATLQNCSHRDNTLQNLFEFVVWMGSITACIFWKWRCVLEHANAFGKTNARRKYEIWKCNKSIVNFMTAINCLPFRPSAFLRLIDSPLENYELHGTEITYVPNVIVFNDGIFLGSPSRNHCTKKNYTCSANGSEKNCINNKKCSLEMR